MKNRTGKRQNRRGVLVVLFALLLPVLIILLGFSVDYANMQRVRNEARAIADIAAKVAANRLASTQDIVLARQAAKDVAAQNTIGGETITLRDKDIVFGKALKQGDGSYSFTGGSTPFNSVRVFAGRTDDTPEGPVSMMFGSFYGHSDFSTSQSATASFVDVEVCLVLDRSGSMKHRTVGTTTSEDVTERTCLTPYADSRWAALDSAVGIFLDELATTHVQEKVGLVTFASDFTVCSNTVIAASIDETLTRNLTNLRNEMNNRTNQADWGGDTNVTAGLELGRVHMNAASNPDASRYIIVLTDGIHNDGDPPFDVATQAAADGFVVHTITFSDDANQADMQTVAANGGGVHHHAVDEAELAAIFRRLAGSFAILTE